MKRTQLICFFILVFSINLFPAIAQSSDPIPEHETITIRSAILEESRTINVWTPPVYTSSPEALPVLYMLDGGTKEDFPHLANTLSELISAKKIKPLILVGIENTQRRRDLTGHTEIAKDKNVAPVVGGSEKFRAFIRDELFPEIKKRYRTTHEKSLIGESLAGLFVMETFFSLPGMFTNYIAFDPSLWWNKHYLVRTAKAQLAKFPETKIRLWFAGSGAKDISKYTRELSGILETTSLPNLNWKYSDEPEEVHSTIFRAKKEKAILWTFNPNN